MKLLSSSSVLKASTRLVMTGVEDPLAWLLRCRNLRINQTHFTDTIYRFITVSMNYMPLVVCFSSLVMLCLLRQAEAWSYCRSYLLLVGSPPIQSTGYSGDCIKNRLFVCLLQKYIYLNLYSHTELDCTTDNFHSIPRRPVPSSFRSANRYTRRQKTDYFRGGGGGGGEECGFRCESSGKVRKEEGFLWGGGDCGNGWVSDNGRISPTNLREKVERGLVVFCIEI